MRKFTTLVAALLMAVATFAQAPQGFSYQAVVRDAQNAIVANQTVEVTVTILQGASADAAKAVFTEKHSAKTNANGLFTITVGSVDNAEFAKIDWGKGNSFLKTESAYGESTTQLMSVPYALYAEKAASIDAAQLAQTLNSNDVKAILNLGATTIVNNALASYTTNQKLNDTLAVYAKIVDLPEGVNLTGYAKTADLAAVATTGSYNDLTNKPDFATKAEVEPLQKALKTNFGNEFAVANNDVVDLGLSSGNLWAACNLGASSPSDGGGFYAWGETETKSEYTWSTYKYGDSEHAITKYCTISQYGDVDNRTALENADDAAAANLGKGWVMPTIAEWDELYNQCYWVHTTDYNGTGKEGYIVYKSANKTLDKQQTKASDHTYSLTTDEHIFLPLAGYIAPNNVFQGTECGWYWSSTLEGSNSGAEVARLYRDDDIVTTNFGYTRAAGLLVRPIRRADATVLSNYVTLTQLQEQIAALQNQLTQLQNSIPTKLGDLDHTADLSVTVNYVINNDYPAEYNTPEDAWVIINGEKVTSTKTFSNLSTSADLVINGKFGAKTLPAGWSYHGYYEIFVNGKKWEILRKQYRGITSYGSQLTQNNVNYKPAYITESNDADKADYKVELIGKPTSTCTFNPNHYDYSSYIVTIPCEDLYKNGNCQIVINMYVTAYPTN